MMVLAIAQFVAVRGGRKYYDKDAI